MSSAPLKVPDPLDFFPGEWTFERRITDRLNSQTGEAWGKAIFKETGEGLLWTELGELRMNGRTFGASRILEIVGNGDDWTVRFDDGRHFHPLDLSDGRCAVDHPCGDDVYTGDFTADVNGFTTDWRVRGPHKDQRIATTYARI